MFKRRLTFSKCVMVICALLIILWVLKVMCWSVLVGRLNRKFCTAFGECIRWLWLVTCCILPWFWLRRGRRPSPPLYPGALPLIGNAHQFLGDSVHMWNLMKDFFYYSLKKGGVICIQIGVYTTYVITDPDDYLTVSNTCLDKPYIYNFAKTWLGNGLVTADVKTWKLHRKLLNPAFSQQMLNMLVDLFNDQSRILVDNLRVEVGQGFFDPEPYLIRNILDTSCQATLNLKPKENSRGVDYTMATKHLMDCLLERFQKIWLHVPSIFMWSSLKRKQDKYLKTAADVTSAIIQKRKLKLQQQGVLNKTNSYATDNCKTLLDLLLHSAENRGVFTDADIREHLDTIIVASYDTTGSTLLFTLALLGSHQHVQDRVYQELQQLLEDTEENIDKNILKSLVYLEAVLKESMRLYPAIPLVGRNVLEDVKLKNYTIAAGSICFLSIYGIHRHPMWGADAEQFRPERWLEPGGVPDHPNAFASFSLGRRNCIGKLYALMSVKTTLVHLLRRYRVTADASKLMMKWDPVLRPVSGHDISLELRT